MRSAPSPSLTPSLLVLSQQMPRPRDPPHPGPIVNVVSVRHDLPHLPEGIRFSFHLFVFFFPPNYHRSELFQLFGETVRGQRSAVLVGPTPHFHQGRRVGGSD